MQIFNKSIDKITTVIKDEPVRITNCYFLGPVENPIENDYLNTDIGNILNGKDTPVTEGEYMEFRNGKKVQCIFHNKTMKDSPALDFSDFQINDNERIFVINNLRCSHNRKVIMRIGKNCRSKVWINDLLVVNSAMGATDSYFLTFELKKGNNIVFSELSFLKKETPISYSLRVNDYYNEFTGIDGELLKDYFYQNVFNKAAVLQEKWNFTDSSSYEFMLIPRDFVNIKKDEKILVKVTGENESLLEEFEIKFYQKVDYFIEKSKNDILLTFGINYKTLSSKDEYLENVILIQDVKELISHIEEQYQQLKHNFNLNDEDKVNIEGRIKYIMNGGPVVIKNERKVISKIIDYIKKGRHFKDFIIENGPNSVYYTSTLDNQIEKYYISIPKDYSYTYKYPLVIFSSTGRYASFSAYFSKLENWQLIIVDIGGRGITTGSYIGESSFMEIFQNIIKKYNIDMDRVYLTGYSNGAFATWALAQAYPYLFSAIIPISGAPNKENLKNLININIMSICGDKDYLLEAGNRIPSDVLTEYNKYTGITIKEADHNSVYFYGFGKYMITWLLQHKKTRYPEKIYFRTERIRHNKTYWIEICSIDKTTKFAEVIGEIVNNSTISLALTGVTQFILTIPEYVNTNDFVVRINDNNVFSFTNTIGVNQLYFKKSGNSYVQLKNVNEIEPQRNCMGMGILDIYMDSLKIIIPTENNSEESTIINNIAHNFAKPVTYGWDPVVYVNYPIINEDILTRDDLEKSNLIILGCKNNSQTVEIIKDKLPIKFDDYGYNYKDIYTKGDYCLILICSNPFNDNKKVLLIYANNHTLLKKGLFTRKLILPSYSNGLHLFLNNEAIIYNGIEYFVIDVLGNDIIKTT